MSIMFITEESGVKNTLGLGIRKWEITEDTEDGGSLTVYTSWDGLCSNIFQFTIPGHRIVIAEKDLTIGSNPGAVDVFEGCSLVSISNKRKGLVLYINFKSRR